MAKKKNIVLVTKDGSRWKDANGSNTCHFPPHEIISKLPLDVQKAFDSKAIGHSDEYYQAFKDQLLRRLKRMGTPQQNGGRLQNRQSWSGGGLHGSSSFQALAPGIDSAVINEVVVSSERSLSTKIISTERTLRDQIDVSEQAITKKLRAHGQDIAELVQSIENRLNTKLEARMREIKEELVASTQGIKEVISDLKLSTSFGGGGGQGVSDGGGGGGGSPLSPGGARPSTALSRSTDNHQTSAFASHPNTSTTAAINTASSQLQVYNGSPSSLLPPTSSSSSSSPMAARISRPMSGRPHTGSPTVYQIPQQGRGSITMGGSMSIKGLTNKTSSPRI